MGGSAATPVRISSYGTGRATIAAGTGAGIGLYNVAGIEVSNLNLVGAGPAGGNNKSGIDIYNDLGGATKLSYIRINNMEVSGFGRTGIILGAWPSDRTQSGFKDVGITNVVIRDGGQSGIETYGYYPAPVGAWAHENVYISRCRILNIRGYADTGSHSGSGIILGNLNGATVERCIAYNNGENSNYAGGGPVGIWAWESNDVVIQHNESYGNRTRTLDGGGFDLDGGVTNSVLQYNYSHDNYGPGYLICQFNGARPFNNNVVRYNISENDGRKGNYSGIHFWNGGSGIRNTDVYNNTVFVSPQSGATPAALRFQNGTNSTHVRNNIFVSTGGATLLDVAAGQNDVQIQGNSYWSSGANFVIRWAGTVYSSLDAWSAATGQERVGTTNTGYSIDPLLSSPGNGGTIGNADFLATLSAYKLQASSPLIDHGLNLPGLFGIDAGTQDFYEVAIPQGAGYDVGASEWVPGATPPPPPPGPVVGTGDGLAATYYNEQNLTGTSIARVDPQINFLWGSGSPSTAIAADTFSARWTGRVQAQYSQSYTFFIKADDGVRLWVNGQLLVDQWKAQAATEYSGTLALVAGQQYEIKVEYFEGSGGASCELRWSSASTPKQIIPQSQLYSVSTAPQPPTAPSGLTATAVSTSQINLGWTDNASNESGYKIERSLDNSTWSEIISVGANVASYSNTGLSAGTLYYYRVRGYNGGGSTLSNTASATTQSPTTGPVVGTGDGLAATYYNEQNFTGSTVSRIDPQINFNWGSGSPSTAIAPDTFSARWTGRVQAQYTQNYTFYLRGDDGIRLWVNGQLLVDQWKAQAPTEYSGTLALVAGQQYEIKVEYFEGASGALCELRWSSASTPKQFIPQSQLYSASASS